MGTATITLPAARFADEDDCLQAAADAVAEWHESLAIYGAEWADDQRDEIIVRVSRPTITVGDCRILDVSGAQNIVYLDPETYTVSVFSNVGPGVPMKAWHGRMLSLGRVNASTVPSALEACLEDRCDELAALVLHYEGTRWDGNNHRGVWCRPDDDWGFGDYTSVFDDLPKFWDACDWLQYMSWQEFDWKSGTLDELVKGLCDEAEQNDAHLDSDDVRVALVAKVEHAIDNSEYDEDEAGLLADVARLCGLTFDPSATGDDNG